MLLFLACAQDPVEPEPDEADACEVSGNVCAWLGVPETALFEGDGLHRLEAHLYLPIDLSFGSDGTAYYPDYNHHRIRRVAADGVVETISGTGRLDEPWGHVTDVVEDPVTPGWLWVASDGQIAQLDAATGDVTTWAEMFTPTAVVPAEDGTVYVSDPGGDGVQVFAPDGTVTVLAALHGPSPSKLALDGRTLYVADTGGDAVLGIDLDTGVVEVVVGTELDGPSDVAVGPDGELYVVDTKNHCVRVVRDGVLETFAGRCAEEGYAGDGGPATDALFAEPYGVAVDAEGYVYVADTSNHVIRRIAP